VITGATAAEISMGEPLDHAEKSAALRIFLKALFQVPMLKPAELNLTDPQDLVLYTAEGCMVFLGDSEKMTEKLILLQAFLQEGRRGNCLDLRAGDRLVVVSGKNGE
ncbi:MAG: hypothetical protein GX878_06375, partial [Firmicutes bacterium]|nr:hypothetical protein [Bacillota bacterium]